MASFTTNSLSRPLAVAAILASALITSSASAQYKPPPGGEVDDPGVKKKADDGAPADGDAKPAPAPEPAAPAPAPAAPPAGPAPSPEPEEDKDGVRFRGGVSLGGGGLFLNNDAANVGLAVGMGGVQGHIGVQIMDLVGIYVTPHFALGAGEVDGVGGIVTGTVGAELMVDFTIIDQIFVGVGAGPGVVGSAPGANLHVRAGGYPVFGYGEDGIRRKGLAVGMDLNAYFFDDEFLAELVTPIEAKLSIGYEAF